MSYTAIDLSRLPAPAVVEPLDFETILGEMVSDLQARDPSFSALVESDPAFKILEVAAYRELLLRQRVNDAALATMLAYALGTDLDRKGEDFGVERKLLSPADPETIPPTPAVWESDEEYRRLIHLSREGLSTAGPEGAYVYHAVSADPQVLDATAVSHQPGEVLVTVLSRQGDGTASPDIIDAVRARLSSDDVRPLTDFVTVQSAEILGYDVRATVYTYPGPDSAVVLAEARRRLDEYTTGAGRLARTIPTSGIIAALHAEGVQRIVLHSPAVDVQVSTSQAGYCRAVEITDGGSAF